ncbi:MAG: hypothetical protein QW328_06900 [Nitrososphaerota archaeon]
MTKSREWLEKAIDLIKKHEGFRMYAYPDPLSHLGRTARHVGFGFKPAEQIIKIYKFNPKDGEPWTIGFGFTEGVSFRDGPMTLEQAESILNGYVRTKYLTDLIDLCRARKIDFDSLPDEVKIALLNMIYAMGKNRLARFEKMFEALKKRDYIGVSVEILNSVWATSQAPRRAREISNLVLSARDYL